MLAILITLSACGAHTKVARLDPDGVCPPSETCVSFMSSGMDAEGGGVQKTTILFGGTQVVPDKNGQPQVVPLGAKVISASANDDRIDRILPIAGQIYSTERQVHAIKYGARSQERTMKYASDNSGLQTLIYNEGSYAGANAQQTSDVDVGIGVSQDTYKPYNPMYTP